MSEQSKKTAEEIQAEKEARAAAKQAEKEVKAAQAAQAKAEKEAARAAVKAEKEAEKAAKAAEVEAKKEAELAEKAAKVQEKEAKAAAKEAEKARKLAEKEASKMPEQNGVRRPKPETLCGKAWAIFDDVSAQTAAPATIAESLEIARVQELNEANVRTEYARWRKFNGITGRLASPVKAEADVTTESEVPAAE